MDISSLLSSYQAAAKRLFLLDYDGTLVDLKPTPPEAKPTPELLRILAKLLEDPRNTIVIISGRDHKTLDGWLGDLPLALVAEHGMLFKEPGGPWQTAMKVSDRWKPAVRKLMDHSAQELSGVIVEEKTNALAWHCRAVSDKQRAQDAESSLSATLQPLAIKLGLRLIRGDNVIEVQPLGVDKGKAAEHWLQKTNWDFILAAGDDTTDEDLFANVPEAAWSIKVRDSTTMARATVASPYQLLAILSRLADA